MYMGARIAWCVSLILLVTIVFLDVAVYHQPVLFMPAYTLALAIVLVISRRAFPHHRFNQCAGFVAFICTIRYCVFLLPRHVA